MGRRLAFDGAKGRLWVVCAKCGRWNLTPLEERWEAIEECERQYRGTKLRSSTDEIGLGKLREGLDLIRIGSPLRPEFAAWRYGKHFRRRYQTRVIAGAAGVTAWAALTLAGFAASGFVMPAFQLGYLLLSRQGEVRRARQYILERASQAKGRKVKESENVEIRIIPYDDEQGWALRFFGFATPVDFTGRDALHTAHMVMPAINMFGGSPASVVGAVKEIEEAGSPERYFKRIVAYSRENHRTYMSLKEFPAAMRLAAEMAAHEETERAALEGELQQLETDWREAEEIASIADNLFLPKSVTDFIDRHKPG